MLWTRCYRTQVWEVAPPQGKASSWRKNYKDEQEETPIAIGRERGCPVKVRTIEERITSKLCVLGGHGRLPAGGGSSTRPWGENRIWGRWRKGIPGFQWAVEPTFTYAFIHGVKVCCHCLVHLVFSASVQKHMDTPLSPLSIKIKWKGHYVAPDTCVVHRGWEPTLERPGSCSCPAPITSWAFPESFPAAWG